MRIPCKTYTVARNRGQRRKLLRRTATMLIDPRNIVGDIHNGFRRKATLIAILAQDLLDALRELRRRHREAANDDDVRVATPYEVDELVAGLLGVEVLQLGVVAHTAFRVDEYGMYGITLDVAFAP